MVEKAGFVSSANFVIKHVLGLVLSGDTVSQRARYLKGFSALLQRGFPFCEFDVGK